MRYVLIALMMIGAAQVHADATTPAPEWSPPGKPEAPQTTSQGGRHPAPPEESWTPAGWQSVGGGLPHEPIAAIALVPSQPGRVFAATERALYESADHGMNWHERFRASAQSRITRIAVVGPTGPPAWLVATTQGLYGSFDEGATWSRVFSGATEGDSHCTYVMFHPRRVGVAWLGTRGGLLVSEDHGRRWRPVDLPREARQIIHFAADPEDLDRVYVVARQGVFAGHITQGQWERRLAVAAAEEPEVEEASQPFETVEERDDSLHHLSAIAVDPQQPSTLYLASSDGLAVSHDRGRSWRPLPRTGLVSAEISGLALQRRSPLVLYAATSRGVACPGPSGGTAPRSTSSASSRARRRPRRRSRSTASLTGSTSVTSTRGWPGRPACSCP